jgi:hypothetical protein
MTAGSWERMVNRVFFLALALLLTAAAAFGQLASDFDTSGFWARLGIGIPVPIDLSSKVLTAGLGAAPACGYWFPLGVGRIQVGLESGVLLEYTQGLPSIDQYASLLVPIMVLAVYELPLGELFHVFGGVQTGAGVAFVDYDLASLPDLVTTKFLFGVELGAGLGAGMLTVQAGMRFFAVFYDVNPYLAVVPEVRAVIRFPEAVSAPAPAKADVPRANAQPKMSGWQ